MADFLQPRPDRNVKDIPGSAFANIVNIGIGGSDLGPVMAYEAPQTLQRTRHDVSLRFQHRWRPTFAEQSTISILRKLFSSSLRKRSRRWDDDERSHGSRLVGQRVFGGDQKSVARHFVAVLQ